MKSTAHFKGHPVHPMLIVFPIAFFTGTLIADVIYVINHDVLFFNIATYLCIAGVVAGLIAAIPGTIDFFFTVPPQSSGKKRALQHGLLNVAVVVLFAINFFYRQDADASRYILLIMDASGFAGLTISGWMGGTLVYRNQIGVNPRTAFAGKWRELRLEAKDNKITLDTPKDLKRDQMILLHADDKRIVLARDEKGFVAFDDHCTHRGGSLAGGMMICGTVQCPWHGSQFDVHTGEVKAGPAKQKINTYKLTEDKNKINIQLK